MPDIHTRIDTAISRIKSLPSKFLTVGEICAISEILRRRERYTDQEFTADTLEQILQRGINRQCEYIPSPRT